MQPTVAARRRQHAGQGSEACCWRSRDGTGRKDLRPRALEGLGAGGSEAQERKPVLDQFANHLLMRSAHGAARIPGIPRAWMLNVGPAPISGQPQNSEPKACRALPRERACRGRPGSFPFGHRPRPREYPRSSGRPAASNACSSGCVPHCRSRRPRSSAACPGVGPVAPGRRRTGGTAPGPVWHLRSWQPPGHCRCRQWYPAVAGTW